MEEVAGMHAGLGDVAADGVDEELVPTARDGGGGRDVDPTLWADRGGRRDGHGGLKRGNSVAEPVDNALVERGSEDRASDRPDGAGVVAPEGVDGLWRSAFGALHAGPVSGPAAEEGAVLTGEEGLARFADPEALQQRCFGGADALSAAVYDGAKRAYGVDAVCVARDGEVGFSGRRRDGGPGGAVEVEKHAVASDNVDIVCRAAPDLEEGGQVAAGGKRDVVGQVEVAPGGAVVVPDEAVAAGATADGPDVVG